MVRRRLDILPGYDYTFSMNKVCIVCGDLKMEIDFPIHHYDEGGNAIRRNQCNVCRMKVTCGAFMKRRQDNTPTKDGVLTRDLDNARKRARRQNPIKRSRFILEDSRKSDKKKGRENNLTKEFIEELISNGCSYCGENKIMICLDRIDNSMGHIKDNVVAACVRCNYIRNSMPYEAWLHIVPLIKDAHIKGLFNNWKTRFW
jgi:hypothetical protein